MNAAELTVRRAISDGIAVLLPACAAGHKLDEAGRLRTGQLLVQQARELLRQADGLMASVPALTVRPPTRTDAQGVVARSNPTTCRGGGPTTVKDEPLPADMRPGDTPAARAKGAGAARGRGTGR